MYLRRHGAPQQHIAEKASHVAHSGHARHTRPLEVQRPLLCPVSPNLPGYTQVVTSLAHCSIVMNMSTASTA